MSAAVGPAAVNKRWYRVVDRRPEPVDERLAIAEQLLENWAER